jgi:hypothetical protein
MCRHFVPVCQNSAPIISQPCYHFGGLLEPQVSGMYLRSRIIFIALKYIYNQ